MSRKKERPRREFVKKKLPVLCAITGKLLLEQEERIEILLGDNQSLVVKKNIFFFKFFKEVNKLDKTISSFHCLKKARWASKNNELAAREIYGMRMVQIGTIVFKINVGKFIRKASVVQISALLETIGNNALLRNFVEKQKLNDADYRRVSSY